MKNNILLLKKIENSIEYELSLIKNLLYKEKTLR